jgi:hypothetical protein
MEADLPPDPSNAETSFPRLQNPTPLAQVLGRSLVVGWGATVILATAGWLYFLAQVGYYLFEEALR